MMKKNIYYRKSFQQKINDVASQGLEVARAEQVQHTFNLIGRIGGQIHRGPLMSQNYVNNQLMNQGNFHEAFGSCQLIRRSLSGCAS